MDILAEVNAWDCENGNAIAAYCGLEELTLYQYLVLLEKVRTDLDKLIPLHPAYRNIALATIDSLTKSAASIAAPSFLEGEFLRHLQSARHTLETGATALPMVERLSLSTCFTVLISQISSFLTIEHGMLHV